LDAILRRPSRATSPSEADYWNNNTPWDIDQKRFTPWHNFHQDPSVWRPPAEEAAYHFLPTSTYGEESSAPESEGEGEGCFSSSGSFTEPVIIPARRKQAAMKGFQTAAGKQLPVQPPCLRGRLITKTGAVWGEYTAVSLRTVTQAACVKGVPAGERLVLGRMSPADAKTRSARYYRQSFSKDQGAQQAGRLYDEGIIKVRDEKSPSILASEEALPVNDCRGMADSLKEACRQGRDNGSFNSGDSDDTCFFLRLNQQPEPWRVCLGFHV
jgi:hypothetical protein